MSQNFSCHGYLGQDPDLRYFPDGTPMVSFSVASTQRWKDQSGETKERTDWFRMVATGRRAEVIAEYFKKGSEIVITRSQFRQREYTKDGEKRYVAEFRVQDFDFCGRREAADRQTGEAVSRPSSQPADTNDFDDDIPF